MDIKVRIAALCAAGQLMCSGPAMSETVMRFSDFLPTTHYLTTVGSQPFMDAITEATGGEIKFEHFPAQQLGKSSDFVRLTQGGVAQISVVGVSFVADKMELSNVAQMPGIVELAEDRLQQRCRRGLPQSVDGPRWLRTPALASAAGTVLWSLRDTVMVEVQAESA